MMSPHDQPWLDDYETRQRVELQAKWDSEGEVFRIQNQAMKTVLRECPDPLRKPENCENCGNENCIKAWKEQNKLWDQPEDQKLPASAARHTDTAMQPEASKSNAATENPDTTSCQLPGPPASGSGLFDLIYSESEDEAA
jgi:hypothetical protein